MGEAEFLTRTRASYDAIAVEYEERLRDELDRRPLERALLEEFARLVLADGGGPLVEIGCGPGRITAWLRDRGLDVSGIDLSPAMISLARERHPDLRFAEGSMTSLTLDEARLAGLVAWYSIIHVPTEELPAVFAGFRAALRPGGHLVIAFQAGDGTRHVSEHVGKQISLDFHRRRPDDVAALLVSAGFEERARLVKAADPDERTAQAVLVFRRL